MLCRSFAYHVYFRKYRRTNLSSSFLITLYNKLYIVATCWTVIDIDSRCTDPKIKLTNLYIFLYFWIYLVSICK